MTVQCKHKNRVNFQGQEGRRSNFCEDCKQEVFPIWSIHEYDPGLEVKTIPLETEGPDIFYPEVPMSRRDYFAAAALNGLLSNSGLTGPWSSAALESIRVANCICTELDNEKGPGS